MFNKKEPWQKRLFQNNYTQGDYSMVKENDKDNRSRNWNIIVYPESAPADWKDLLVQEVSFVCSPIHDKDVLQQANLKSTLSCVVMFWI